MITGFGSIGTAGALGFLAMNALSNGKLEKTLLCQLARSRRRCGDRGIEQRLEPVRGHQDLQRRKSRTLRAGDVPAELLANSPDPDTVSRARRMAKAAGSPALDPAAASVSISRKT